MRCSVPDARPALARRSRAASVCARAALSDLGLNPRVASLKESKTMALTDLARAMKEEGKPVRARVVGRSVALRAASLTSLRPRLLVWLLGSQTLTHPLLS